MINNRWANKWLLSAYFWLSHSKESLEENDIEDCKRCIKECRTRIKYLEELLKE